MFRLRRNAGQGRPYSEVLGGAAAKRNLFMSIIRLKGRKRPYHQSKWHRYDPDAEIRTLRRARHLKAKKLRRNKAKGRRAKARNNKRLDSNGYPKAWTPELRESVRAAHKHHCAWCGDHQENTQESLHVHHVSGNKEDCSFGNLVALCHDCHTLVAHKGKHSDLEGAVLLAAIERQKAAIRRWAGMSAEAKAARMAIDGERQITQRLAAFLGDTEPMRETPEE